MILLPRTGASVIVVRDGKVLLIKRGKAPYKDYWSLPGGAQEPGEKLEETAQRELFEETGLTAGELSFCTVRDRLSHDRNGQLDFHYVLATFFAGELCGDVRPGDDAQEVGWFNDKELDALQTTPETPSLIREILLERSVRLAVE